jgi:hypothetical protein
MVEMVEIECELVKTIFHIMLLKWYKKGTAIVPFRLNVTVWLSCHETKQQ